MPRLVHRPLARTLLSLSVTVLVLAGCGGGSSKPAAASSSTPSASSTSSSSGSSSSNASSSASSGSIDPCKLNEAEVQAIVGFAVTKGPDVGGQGGCDYTGSGNFVGAVSITTVTFPSESDANVIRDGNTGVPAAGVPNAFIDVARGTGDLYKGNTQLEVRLNNPQMSATELNDAIVALVKKFV